MLISLHHCLFVLLPLALVARWAIRPRPAVLDVAPGVMRFCLGIGKGVLLVMPLWHLAVMILHGGPESLSTGVAWMGFLALLPLAATSSNAAIRRMGPVAWARLHKLAYAALVAGLLHLALLSKVWTVEVLVYCGLGLGLLALRLVPRNVHRARAPA